LDIIELSILVITLNLEIAIVSMNMGSYLRKPASLMLLAVSFALFHCFFSLAGFTVGSAMNSLFGTVGRYISSAVLTAVGIRILIASFVSKNGGLGEADLLLILFGAGVEDFAGGVSVGTGAFGGGAAKLALAFLALSIPMNLAAFLTGRVISKKLNISADFVSGLLLVCIGILSAFNII